MAGMSMRPVDWGFLPLAKGAADAVETPTGRGSSASAAATSATCAGWAGSAAATGAAVVSGVAFNGTAVWAAPASMAGLEPAHEPLKAATSAAIANNRPLAMALTLPANDRSPALAGRSPAEIVVTDPKAVGSGDAEEEAPV